MHIFGVKAGNVTAGGGSASCYQAFVLLGPLASSYNGPDRPAVSSIANVTLGDCDFGTPANAARRWFIHSVAGLRQSNITIGGKTYDLSLSA
uniref:Family 28 glycoside hydrolase n=1 Tax=uncultured bacterium BLR13 TaxID=506515 RepID=C0INK1_9BACT|nr:family 28 glycoside hydrolase [uncultured bacterium BLR13]